MKKWLGRCARWPVLCVGGHGDGAGPCPTGDGPAVVVAAARSRADSGVDNAMEAARRGHRMMANHAQRPNNSIEPTRTRLRLKPGVICPISASCEKREDRSSTSWETARERCIGIVRKHSRGQFPKLRAETVAVLGRGSSITEVVRACIHSMRQAGIFQWDEIYPNRELVEEDVREGALYVAQENGITLGAVCLNEKQDAAYHGVKWYGTGPVLVVHRLCVDPVCQGQGIARRLMDFAEEYARLPRGRRYGPTCSVGP
jgi:GNAT superfamily N-acetyltransferase